MNSLFCSNTGSTLTPTMKVALQAVGIVVFANNPALATTILPVAEGIQTAIDGGSDNTAMNTILQQGISQLISHSSSNPVITAEINLAMTAIGINVATPKMFDNATLKDIIDTFVAGLKVAQPKS